LKKRENTDGLARTGGTSVRRYAPTPQRAPNLEQFGSHIKSNLEPTYSIPMITEIICTPETNKLEISVGMDFFSTNKIQIQDWQNIKRIDNIFNKMSG
jgi:hypothetical protein